MSLFRRIFKKGEPDIQRAHVSRAPRIPLKPLHSLSFQRKESNERHDIANISSSGMALFTGRSPMVVGDHHLGTLTIHEESIDVEIQVVRTTPEITGAKFVTPSPALEKLLRKYFEVEISALKLRAMKKEHLKPSEDGDVFCFTGENHTSLYFIVKDSKINYFEFSFFGNFIEGHSGENLKFGNLVTDDLKDEVRYQRSTIIDHNIHTSDDMISVAINFLEHIEGLERQHLRALTDAIRNKKL